MGEVGAYYREAFCENAYEAIEFAAGVGVAGLRLQHKRALEAAVNLAAQARAAALVDACTKCDYAGGIIDPPAACLIGNDLASLQKQVRAEITELRGRG